MSAAIQSKKPKLAFALRLLNWAFLVIALLLAAYGQERLGRGDLQTGVLSFAFAMVIFAGAVRGVSAPEPATPARPLRDVPRARRLAGLSVLIIAMLCLTAALWRLGNTAPDNLSWALYLASMALFWAAFVVMDWRPDRAWWRRLGRRLRDLRWELFLLLIIVLLGALARFYGLDVVPMGVWYDESDNAVWAREILMQNAFRPLYVSSTNLPAHFLYFIALSFKLLGVNAVALRVVTAAFGTATIIGMWLLGRELGGRWAGLLSAGLLAASHWAINFSRLGMHGITTPFFAVFSAYLLLRGLRAGSRPTLAAGGLTLGFGLCFYAPFRLFPAVIVAFLLGKLLFERGFFKRGWLFALIYIAGSVLAFAPVGQYALSHQQEFFGRQQQTSLFAGKTPAQRWPALKSNTRVHLLMFNYQGDRNGRHNLPGEPMLDPIAGAFLPLGAAYVIARLHRPRQLMLATWGAVMLSAGIFSLDFEAPQSLRAIGSMPAVFLMIGQVVPVIGRELAGLFARRDAAFSPQPFRLVRDDGTATQSALSRRLFGRLPDWAALKAGARRHGLHWAATALVATGILAGFLYSAKLNYTTYFVRQARDPVVFHAYNAREAVVARRFVLDANKYRFYTIYEGHPTVRFLAPEVPDHHPFQPTDDLPVRGLVDRDVLYMLEPEFAPPPAFFQAWYPGGELKWYSDPAGNPMLFTFEVKKDEVNESQGVIFRLFAADDHEGKTPLLERRVDTPAMRWDDLPAQAGPTRGEWTGQVFAPASGTYRLRVVSTGTASLTMGDRSLLLPDGGDKEEARVLPKGWHTLRFVADVVAGGEARVEWTRPDGQSGVIGRDYLNTNPGLQHGLYGYYYPGLEWKGMPAFARIDWQVNYRWHVQPMPVPFSVEWIGGLKVDSAGSYLLGVDSNSGAWLELNGQVLIDNLTPPHGPREVSITLQPGVYPIRVRYHEADGYSLMRLQWRAPGGPFEPIPAENLLPRLPEGIAAPAISLPEPTATPAPPPPPKPAAPVEDAAQVEVTLVRAFGVDAKLEKPRAIAVGPDGRIYVSDSAKAAVLAFDPAGRLIGTWGKGKLKEPSDLTALSDGSLFVIDANASRLVHFDAAGKALNEIGQTAGFYGPRGLALSAQGNLVIADTGSNRIVLMTTDGRVAGAFGSQGNAPGQFQQPIDVAVGPDGRIYVADTLINKRVQIFAGDGGFVDQWLTPWTSDFSVPAMAVAGDGRIYMADAERGRVWEYAAPAAKPVWWRAGDLKRPIGLALDRQGQIYVVDEETRLIYQFKRP